MCERSLDAGLACYQVYASIGTCCEICLLAGPWLQGLALTLRVFQVLKPSGSAALHQVGTASDMSAPTAAKARRSSVSFSSHAPLTLGPMQHTSEEGRSDARSDPRSSAISSVASPFPYVPRDGSFRYSAKRQSGTDGRLSIPTRRCVMGCQVDDMGRKWLAFVRYFPAHSA